MALVQKLVSPSKYGIKCPYSMNPIGICIHNTYNDAPAINEINYMHSNNQEVSFHVAVDDKEAIQGVPFNRNAWAAGDGGKGTGNRYYIHWEICYSKSGGTRFLEAEKRAAKEIAADLKRRGWGIDRVKKHQDFSGKYCPHKTMDLGYQRLMNMIKAELGSASSSSGSPNSNTASNSITAPKGSFYRVVAGSYLERGHAEGTQSSLKSAGYSTFLLPVTAKDGKTYLRVIAGSYQDKANAQRVMNELIAKGFQAFVAIYNSGDNVSPSNPVSVPVQPTTPVVAVGSKVHIKGTKYVTGQLIPDEQRGTKVHTVQQITGDKALLKEIYSWVYTSDLEIVGATSSQVTTGADSEVRRYTESGKCTVTTESGLRFRDKPTTDGSTVTGTYSRGESVHYDLVVISKKYVWISWISATAGVRRYMAIKDVATGERYATCE